MNPNLNTQLAYELVAAYDDPENTTLHRMVAKVASANPDVETELIACMAAAIDAYVDVGLAANKPEPHDTTP